MGMSWELPQGQGISPGFPGDLPLPSAPELLFDAFSKWQHDSSVIYADQQTAFSSSLVIFTLPVTSCWAGVHGKNSLVGIWFCKRFTPWKPLAKKEGKSSLIRNE